MTDSKAKKLHPLPSILCALLGLAVFMLASILSQLARMLPLGSLTVMAQALACIAMLYYAYRFLGRKLLRSSLKDMRMKDPARWWPWLLLGLALPLVLYGAYGLLAPGRFVLMRPLSFRGLMAQHLPMLISAGLMAGVTEEMAFRGFLFRALELGFGKKAAILVPNLAFGLIHIMNIGTAPLSSVVMLVVVGASVGILFALAAEVSGSIWASALLHGLWNALVIGGVFSIGPGPVSPIGGPLLGFALSSDSILWTGGDFGVEASLPAILIYWASIVGLLLWRRKHPQDAEGAKGNTENRIQKNSIE